jgi:hypothetical protein
MFGSFYVMADRLGQILPLFFCRKTGALVAWIQVRSIAEKIRGNKARRTTTPHFSFSLRTDNLEV